MRKALLAMVLCAVLAAFSAASFAAGTIAPTTPSPTVPTATLNTIPSPGTRSPMGMGMRSIPAPAIDNSMRMLRPQMADMLAGRLKLTDDQKAKVTDVLTKGEKSNAPLVEAQQKATKAYYDALGNPDTTQAALKSAVDSVMKAESEMMNAWVGTLFDLKSILTADQNKQLSEMLSMHGGPFRGPGAMGAPGGVGAAPFAAPTAPPPAAPTPAGAPTAAH